MLKEGNELLIQMFSAHRNIYYKVRYVLGDFQGVLLLFSWQKKLHKKNQQLGTRYKDAHIEWCKQDDSKVKTQLEICTAWSSPGDSRITTFGSTDIELRSVARSPIDEFPISYCREYVNQ